jgi:hypothetical protein
VLTVLLFGVVGVGVWGPTTLRDAQDEIVNEIGTELPDLAQMKFYLAAFHGSELAYGLDALRGVAGAADDGVGTRKAFLDNVEGFRAAHEDLTPHLEGGEIPLDQTLRTDFDQYMKNDGEIIALYRSGSPADAALAARRIAEEQAPLFENMAGTIQTVVDGVQGETADLQQQAADAPSTSRNLMLALGRRPWLWRSASPSSSLALSPVRCTRASTSSRRWRPATCAPAWRIRRRTSWVGWGPR